jgi:hypothetical protein
VKILALIFCLICTYSFGQQKEFEWLIGTWQEEGKQAFEVWTKTDDFLSAESYKMKDGNRIVTEENKIIKKGNDFFYVPDVAGPQGPIEFKITSFDKNSFTAENPAHDFPQKIIYKRVDENHLQAFVSKKDNTNILRFFYSKIE